MSLARKRITKELEVFLHENPDSEGNFDVDKMILLGKYKNVNFSIHLNAEYPFKAPRVFINNYELTITNWIGQLKLFPLIIEKINKIQNQPL